MNSNIKFFLSQADIPPVSYTWMDISDYYLSAEEWDAVLAKVGKLNSLPISDYPLPFERIAVVAFTSPLATVYGDGGKDTVTLSTIERVNEELLYTFHMYMGNTKAPSAMGKVRHAPIELQGKAELPQYGKAMTFKFEKVYKQMSMLKGVREEDLMRVHGDHLSSIVRKLVALSVKPDPIVPVGRPQGDSVKNAKRKRKGKSQFWEWKTIELKATATLPAAPLGGTHASPKPHERMGHWRQYKSGKRVFVKAQIINKHKISTDGFVFHDYVKH